MHQLSFTRAHSYAGRDPSIVLPVVIRAGERFVDLIASLDTGASYCLFESGYAAEIGLDLHRGVLTRFRSGQQSI